MTNRLSPFSFGSPPEALGSISPLFAYPPFRSYPATAHARSCAPRSPIAALGERGKHPKTSRQRRESRPNCPKRAPERAVSGSNGALVQGHNHKYHNDLDPRVWLHTPLPRLARSRARTRNLPCETHANSSVGCDRLQHERQPAPARRHAVTTQRTQAVRGRYPGPGFLPGRGQSSFFVARDPRGE